jgi:hypothetical protein
VLIVIACLVSAISWKKIEQPIRHLKISNIRTFVMGGAATAMAALFSLSIFLSAGLNSRIPEDLRSMADRNAMKKFDCVERLPFSKLNASYQDNKNKKRCVIGSSWENSTYKAVLWGDSHAGHFVQMLDWVAKQHNISILYYFSCPPYIDNEKIVRTRHRNPGYSGDCGAERKEILGFLKASDNIDFVILAALWSAHYRRVHEPGKLPDPEAGAELMRLGMSETIAQINPARIPLLLISDVPGVGRDMTACVIESKVKLLIKSCDYETASRNVSKLQYHGLSNRALADVAMHNEGVHLLNTVDKLCDDKKCDNYVNNEFIYRDSNHLRLNLSADTVVHMVERLGLDQEIRSILKTRNEKDQTGFAVGHVKTAQGAERQQ